LIDDLRDAYRSLQRARSAMYLIGGLYLAFGGLIVLFTTQEKISFQTIVHCIIVVLPSVPFFILPSLIRIHRWARLVGIVVCGLMMSGWLVLLSLFILRGVGIHDFLSFRSNEVTALAVMLAALAAYHGWLIILLARCLQFSVILGGPHGFEPIHLHTGDHLREL
jgi:hypothetical protein